MRKILYTLVLMILFIPSINAIDYKIENYKINVTILDNGNIEVEEAFNMNEPYNGYERIIYYKNNYNDYLGSIISSVEDNKIYNGDSVELQEVRAINFLLDNDFSYLKENGDLFKKSNDASKGDYGLYTITKIENGEKYKIYNSSIMNKDFYLNYILENVGITHSDVSEIPFNLSLFKESIKNLEVYIHVPNNKELLKAWVHNVENEIEIIDTNTIKIYISNVLENESFDFRIVCDRNVNYKKKTNQIVYDKINKIEDELKKELNDDKDLEYEKLKSLSYDSVLKVEKTLNRNDYNYALTTVSTLNEDDNLKTELIVRLMNVESRILRKEMFIKLFYTSILFSWFIGLIILYYYIYKRYDKEYKVTFKLKKIDYIPSDMKVSSVGYLFRKKINNNDLKASILNLIYNDNIRFSKLTDKDFILRKISTDDLCVSDLKIMKMIFDDKNMIKFSKLKDRVTNNYSAFLDNYSNWITRATIEAEELELYENILLPKILGIIISLIGFALGIIFFNVDTYFSSYIVLILSIVSLIYFIFLTKKTAKGDEKTAEFKALKNYLDSYNKVNNVCAVDILNKYFVYSIVFNNYNKVSKYISSRYIDIDKRMNKEISKNIYMNDCIIRLVDELLTKAYGNKSDFSN